MFLYIGDKLHYNNVNGMIARYIELMKYNHNDVWNMPHDTKIPDEIIFQHARFQTKYLNIFKDVLKNRNIYDKNGDIIQYE